MRSSRLWARMLGLGEAVVEGVEFDDDEQLIVVSVRPRKASNRRCGLCGKRCPGYDQGAGRRRWRALDLGTIQTFLEADSPRVRCAVHGVVAAQVPWARHDAGHTYAFDDTAAWLVTHCSKSAVRDLLRIAWRTVGSIVTRVVADAENVLIRLPQTGLVQAKWTETILDETFRSLHANRPDLDETRLQRTRPLMNLAVRDAVVTGYEPLIGSLHLPDLDDRHVLAAAIRAQARSTGGRRRGQPSDGSPRPGGRLVGPGRVGDQGPDVPVREGHRGVPHQPKRSRQRQTRPGP